MRLIAFIFVIGLVLANAASSQAQNSSLFARTADGAIPQSSVSLLYSQATQPRQLKVNDLIRIRVNELSEFTSKGELSRRNNSTIDAQLRNWIELDGLNLKASPTENLPRVAGTYTSNTRANGELTTRDKLAFNITVTIVDIRPSGNLVFEGIKKITVDDELVTTSITGIVSPNDIPPDRIVLSDKVADIVVNRTTEGIVRDSYKRGWLTKLRDNLNPF